MTPDVVVLLGLGREARASASYFADGDVRLIALDDHADQVMTFVTAHDRVEAAATMEDAEVALKEAEQPLVLRAPGVPPVHAGLQRLARVAPVTTYTGFWLAHHREHVVASITGTKGKSTTTDLTARLLTALGDTVLAGGNIGATPARPIGGERYVLELSSYQCHDLMAAAPIHAVTSLFHEHTDWHGGHDAYVAAKFHPFTLTPAPLAILPTALAKHLPRRDLTVRYSDEVEEELRSALPDDPVLAHNAALAATIAEAARPTLARADIITALQVVLGARATLPSRRHVIDTDDGVTWIDDALATIPEASWAALQSIPPGTGTIHLILGGKDRGQDFTLLGEQLAGRSGLAVYHYGPTAAKITRALTGTPLREFKDFASLLAAVRSEARPGEVVLFSPAAATPEPRQDYTHRAAAFAAVARRVR